MTDETTWHAPGGNAPPSASTEPSAPPPAQPTYVAPPANGGWRPPPKPGLIPLRPLAFGAILGGGFQVMRRNPRPTFGLAAVLYGIIATSLAAALIGIVSYYSGAINNATSANDVNTFTAGLFGQMILWLLVPTALSVVASAIMQGIVSLEVARGTLGEKLTLRGLWRQARGRIGALIGWSFLLIAAFIAAYIAILVVLVLVTLVSSIAGGAGGVAITVIAFILLFLGLVVFAAWIYIKTSLVPCVILLERRSVLRAIGRSWRLTRGYFWKTLGIQLLVYVILSVASQIVSLPISLVASVGVSLFSPNGDASSGIVPLIVTGIAAGVVTTVIGAIGLVWESATVALIYIDIRMRKEGLDLELLRFVEARQAGDESVADPYLVMAGTVSTPPPAFGSPWA